MADPLTFYKNGHTNKRYDFVRSTARGITEKALAVSGKNDSFYTEEKSVISINITLFIQVVNFLVSLAIINYLIIKPIRGILARRRGIMDGLEENASALNAEAAQKLDGYEARLSEVRAKIAGLRSEAKLQSEADAHAKLESAAEEARGIRRDATRRMQEESEAAQQQLRNRVDELARLALGRVLG